MPSQEHPSRKVLYIRHLAQRLANATLAFLVALAAGGTAACLALAAPATALADEGATYSADKAPELSAQAAYLFDRTTGTVLLDKNADERHYPASMTKIMTALLVLEHASLADEVTVEQADLDMITADSSNAGLRAGETLTVENLLACLLLPSGNESAYVLARHVAGDYQAFVDMMNSRTAELGCTGTHFVNPCGLHDDNHYTTAHDMALILSEAEKNADFVRISGSATWDLPETSMNPARTLKNTDLLVNPESDLYMDAVTCGKTGYTGDAGRCLAAGASKDGLDVVGVVMDAPESEGSAAAISNMHDLLSWGLSAWQTTLHRQRRRRPGHLRRPPLQGRREAQRLRGGRHHGHPAGGNDGGRPRRRLLVAGPAHRAWRRGSPWARPQSPTRAGSSAPSAPSPPLACVSPSPPL